MQGGLTMTIESRDVDIEEDACTVTCKPKGGSMAVKRGHRIRWRTRNKAFRFKLDFRVKPVEGIATPSAPWPFGTSPPPGEGDNSSGWVSGGVFEGTVAFEEGIFEYDVSAPCDSGLAVLDPMIIVTK